MKKEKAKPKPEKTYNPYELRPPVECWICGTPLYDTRNTRIWFGRRCCRKCTCMPEEETK